jgi:hypothetical protein
MPEILAVPLGQCDTVLARARLIPVDGGDSRLRRHTFGGNDNDLPALFKDQLAEVIEHVVNFRVR